MIYRFVIWIVLKTFCLVKSDNIILKWNKMLWKQNIYLWEEQCRISKIDFQQILKSRIFQNLISPNVIKDTFKTSKRQVTSKTISMCFNRLQLSLRVCEDFLLSLILIFLLLIVTQGLSQMLQSNLLHFRVELKYFI